MSGLLDGGGGSVKAPPVPKTPPVPVVEEGVKDTARKSLPRGRRDTFITGDLVPETKKKKLLG